MADEVIRRECRADGCTWSILVGALEGDEVWTEHAERLLEQHEATHDGYATFDLEDEWQS